MHVHAVKGDAECKYWLLPDDLDSQWTGRRSRSRWGSRSCSNWCRSSDRRSGRRLAGYLFHLGDIADLELHDEPDVLVHLELQVLGAAL